MKTSKRFLLAAAFAALAFTFFGCSGDDGGGDSDGGSNGSEMQTVMYTGISNGMAYTLKIIASGASTSAALKAMAVGVYTPKAGDSYELTVGGKTSTGKVVSYSSVSGDLALKPSNSEVQFTATVSEDGLTEVIGTITYADNTTLDGPGALIPSGVSSGTTGGNPLSSGGVSSSSGGMEYSSSSVDCPDFDSGTHFCDSRDGSVYKWVKIGDQTWMAENLNYGEGSVGRCYEDSPANCAKYGRLYDWAAAMNLPSKCNGIISASDSDCSITSPNHRGLCPAGFHMPTHAEWDVLYLYTDPSYDYSSIVNDCYRVTSGVYSGIDASKLKDQSGWNDNGNGTNEYGFSALPGGGYYGAFGDASYVGYWWSASEGKCIDNDDDYVYYRFMTYMDDGLIQLDYADFTYDTGDAKSYGMSVRCLKD
jgi:uncharacterized protein (TIGR02145 family)